MVVIRPKMEILGRTWHRILTGLMSFANVPSACLGNQDATDGKIAPGDQTPALRS